MDKKIIKSGAEKSMCFFAGNGFFVPGYFNKVQTMDVFSAVKEYLHQHFSELLPRRLCVIAKMALDPGALLRIGGASAENKNPNKKSTSSRSPGKAFSKKAQELSPDISSEKDMQCAVRIWKLSSLSGR